MTNSKTKIKAGTVTGVIDTGKRSAKSIKAEEKLWESEERFRGIIENTDAGYFFIDSQGIIREVNNAWVRMYKYNSADEIVGKHFTVIQKADDVEKAKELVNGIMRGEVEYLTEEFSRKCKDGSIGYHSFSASPVMHLGEVIGIEGFIIDITRNKRVEEALRESELQYRTLGETIPYGVWTTDSTGYCTYVSHSFLEMVDMNIEEIQKFGWLHLLPPEDVEPTKEHWLHCVNTGENFEREHRFKSKDGSFRNVLAIGRPIRDSNGKIIKWVGINLDITQRKQAEEALRENLQKLRTILAHAPLVLSAVNLEGEFILSEGKGLERLGRKPGEFVGVSAFELYKDRPDILGYFRKAMAGESVHAFVDLAGEVFDANYEPIRDAAGNIYGVVAVSNIITELKKVEKALSKRTHELGERVKELDCLYSISKLIEKQDITIEQIFQGTVDAIPSAWQYPEITCARIIYKDMEFKTDNFKSAKWKQANEIIIKGEKVGTLEVFYLKEIQERDEGPFLKEERELINAITARLARIIEQKRMEAALRESEEMY